MSGDRDSRSPAAPPRPEPIPVMSTLPMLLENGCCLLSTGELVALSASARYASGSWILGEGFRNSWPCALYMVGDEGFRGEDVEGVVLPTRCGETTGASFSFEACAAYGKLSCNSRLERTGLGCGESITGTSSGGPVKIHKSCLRERFVNVNVVISVKAWVSSVVSTVRICCSESAAKVSCWKTGDVRGDEFTW